MTTITTTTTTLPEQGQADATVLPLPAGLELFRVSPGTGPAQWAEYPRHPAYVQADPTSLGGRAQALFTFFLYFALILCKRLISYELIPAHVRKQGGLAFVGAAVGNIVRRLFPSRLRSSGQGVRVTEALLCHGVAVVPIDLDRLSAVDTAARPLLDALRQRRGQRQGGGRDFIESRGAALRTSDTELFTAVEAMLSAGHLLDGISAYLGHPARLVDVNPQINDCSDDFWQQIFTDLPPADRPARYFHKDASGGDIKAILYLSDVEAHSGPFSYAVGSHKANTPTLVGWLEETNDQSGFSGTGARARRSFSALPRALQRKCAVGNDLLPGQPVTEQLLKSEWVITARRGHLVVFDTKGFHRGGMVQEGERVVLTCVIG